MGIDIRTAEVLVFREIFGKHVEIDYCHAYVEPYLRCGKSYSLAGGEGFKHVLNELIQFRIIGSDIYGLLAKHWLPININR